MPTFCENICVMKQFAPSTRPTHRRSPVAVFALAVTLLAGALSATFVSSASAKGITVKKATFAKEVTDKFEAKGVTTEFQTTDTVYLLLQIKGRPKKGKVSGSWSFRGESVGTADVDLASVNKGVLFSFGEDTYVKFFFKPGPTGLVVGKSYAVDVKSDGTPVGKYTFSVVPPKTALPSRVITTRLSNADGGPAKKTFGPTDTVYLLFNGDFGVKSWIEATWTVKGKEDPEGTRSLTLKEDVKATDGNFSFLPKGGWPKGSHSVTLVLNDVKVGTYSFTVA